MFFNIVKKLEVVKLVCKTGLKNKYHPFIFLISFLYKNLK